MRGDAGDLLRSGRAMLADLNANPHQLGSALMSIHSALEQHFRATLSQNEQVPLETRMNLFRPKEIDWPKLLDLMITYGGLSWAQGDSIRRYNMIRNGIAHRGELFRGTRRDLGQYADLAESLIAGREPSLADDDHSDALYEIYKAGLGIKPPVNSHPSWEASKPALPTKSATPAPAIQPKTPPTTTPRRSEQPYSQAVPRSPTRYAKERQRGQINTWLWIALVAFILFVLSARLLVTPRAAPQSIPTPTLGLPNNTGIHDRVFGISLPYKSSYTANSFYACSE
jgi:hypothetical protein